ncbi:hypothetical protein ACOMICROBIO_FLGHMIGD_00926 [Vibrio sp. B1FLJ16]|uniref:DUF3604 domain-containing protein n=1 Tax=Vibrio sp. B1FLJ16 TaxID=2751178 RepID=UPI0015F582C7|nr:DUF3604 domain-containing protein [Vibrio sp. B1FLJ16]CAD7802275.1 hypothetical protein ACOMICROBIO_FLGHMIGD_00926 [Vibrio sp. B1FLJ16]CAE6892125.1 hypothetical protein ACOMICROBIO_FLGHMIGD_00926 [Vibrio sp. B1FLJ16]
MAKYSLPLITFFILASTGCNNSQEYTNAEPEGAETAVSPQSDRNIKVNPMKDVYWGDTHNHTGNSFDVFLFGTPNSTPEIAYRFARGEEVESPTTGKPWKLSKPLDFLVVADHAELLGSIPLMYQNTPGISDTKTGKTFLAIAPNKSEENLQKIYEILNYAAFDQPNEANLGAKDLVSDFGGEKTKEAWTRYIETAEKYNNPGTFTTLIGWEWTSNNRGANLHRVIFMPQGGDVANQFIPYSSLESDNPEDLWAWLDATSQKTGAEFVAIPHNPNISLGLMFAETRLNGEPIDADYARKRMKWERSVEITQIKGDSEAHPALSPNDEFADYETYDFALTPDGVRPEPTKADYVRSGLKTGLELEKKVGVNPFKVGFVGSSDSHTGMSSIEENNFGGKGQHDSTPEKRPHPTGLGSSKGWDMGAAGWVGVWAESNTRQSLVDAFQRKEVYATTGPRITLRVFGSFDFSEEDLGSEMVNTGYRKGVPMGGDLYQPSDGRAPGFLISVMKDPDGANLDRVQIIKGWLSEEGVAQEKIYDVALSDGRTDGSVKVGNTVDLSTGKYTNTIGSPELSTFWEDPDFSPEQNAFYYVRALEIPTPRYSLLDAIELGINVAETGHPATIQERVYSSPIWYNSAKSSL